jgi:hypothetical protein
VLASLLLNCQPKSDLFRNGRRRLDSDSPWRTDADKLLTVCPWAPSVLHPKPQEPRYLAPILAGFLRRLRWLVRAISLRQGRGDHPHQDGGQAPQCSSIRTRRSIGPNHFITLQADGHSAELFAHLP